jgi:hypothetical protein
MRFQFGGGHKWKFRNEVARRVCKECARSMSCRILKGSHEAIRGALVPNLMRMCRMRHKKCTISCALMIFGDSLRASFCIQKPSLAPACPRSSKNQTKDNRNKHRGFDERRFGTTFDDACMNMLREHMLNNFDSLAN